MSTQQAGAAEPEPFIARLEKYRKPISYTLGALAVLAIGLWLYSETGRRKAQAGAEALDAARGAFETGNLPAASTAFQQVIQAYRGTDAAYQAELGLNTVRLASGQSQLAVDELRKFANAHPPALYESGAWLLMGGALENLSKFGEAADAYLKAADTAPEDYRKVEGLIGAARSYHLAGKQQEGIAVLRRIVTKYPEATPGVAEAKVRLAELTRGAM
ncbi:MAG TPA: tetratricopeptide repeat protein [Gemmatimonadales bacterium]|nr:tetratricopeptide repeat protein [Gemmatimonadales bacterium]